METKTCTQCKQEKPLADFPKQGLTSTGKQRYRGNCKACHNNQMKARYQKSKEFVNSFKTECQKCGESRVYVLDFHHIADKEFTIGKMRKASQEACAKEIENCTVLCANCHREFHEFERQQQITIQQYLGV